MKHLGPGRYDPNYSTIYPNTKFAYISHNGTPLKYRKRLHNIELGPGKYEVNDEVIRRRAPGFDFGKSKVDRLLR